MDKKEQIITIATQLFSEKGFENTPISLVCEKAGVSKGLVFHHFKSKDGLLREIFSKNTELIMDISKSGSNNYTPKDMLRNIIESVFTQLEADKLYFQLNLGIMLQPGTREILGDLITERADYIFNATQTIFKELDPKNAEVLSYHFIAELDGIALNYLSIFDEYPLTKIKNHLLQKYTEQ